MTPPTGIELLLFPKLSGTNSFSVLEKLFSVVVLVNSVQLLWIFLQIEEHQPTDDPEPFSLLALSLNPFHRLVVVNDAEVAFVVGDPYAGDVDRNNHLPLVGFDELSFDR